MSYTHTDLHELSVLWGVLAHFCHPELLHGVELSGHVCQVHGGVELALEQAVEAVLGTQGAVLLLVENSFHLELTVLSFSVFLWLSDLKL